MTQIKIIRNKIHDVCMLTQSHMDVALKYARDANEHSELISELSDMQSVEYASRVATNYLFSTQYVLELQREWDQCGDYDMLGNFEHAEERPDMAKDISVIWAQFDRRIPELPFLLFERRLTRDGEDKYLSPFFDVKSHEGDYLMGLFIVQANMDMNGLKNEMRTNENSIYNADAFDDGNSIYNDVLAYFASTAINRVSWWQNDELFNVLPTTNLMPVQVINKERIRNVARALMDQLISRDMVTDYVEEKQYKQTKKQRRKGKEPRVDEAYHFVKLNRRKAKTVSTGTGPKHTHAYRVRAHNRTLNDGRVVKVKGHWCCAELPTLNGEIVYDARNLK